MESISPQQTPSCIFSLSIKFIFFFQFQTQVFSGRDGSRLLEDSVIGSGDITGEGISVSFTGYGNDMYLYWLTTCHQSDKNQTKPFKLSPGKYVIVDAVY